VPLNFAKFENALNKIFADRPTPVRFRPGIETAGITKELEAAAVA
jgi:hypothetical protein